MVGEEQLFAGKTRGIIMNLLGIVSFVMVKYADLFLRSSLAIPWLEYTIPCDRIRGVKGQG